MESLTWKIGFSTDERINIIVLQNPVTRIYV